MNKLNNKGQTLIMFVLIIPILILVAILAIDIGNISNSKISLNNINTLALEYGLENKDNANILNDMIDLIQKNDNSITDIRIFEIENGFKIGLSKEENSILGSFININNYTILSEYEGRVENNNFIIKRIKWKG